MQNDVEKEIQEVHLMFQAWYRGDIEQKDLSRIGDRLADDFYIVFPDAKVQTKLDLLNMMTSDYANDKSFRIKLHDITTHQIVDGLYLATYEEWQFWGTETSPQLRLRSSALLRQEKLAFSWIAIHETKIES